MLRLAIVSHAYIEEELRKGIGALARQLDVRVVTPEIADCLVFPSLRMEDSQQFIELFEPIKSVRLFGAQYVFLSRDLGFRKSRPDVICIEYNLWSLMFWQTMVAARLFSPKSRIVLSVKKNTFRRGGALARLKQLVARASLGSVTRVMTASRMTAQLYRELFGLADSRIATFTHLGVDTENFAPATPSRAIEPGRAVLGYAGRLEPHKGIEDLVEAVARCRSATGLDVRLEVCGGGSLSGWLDDRARESDWLTLRGLVPNGKVPDFLRGLDVFVLPARTLPDHEEHDAHALLEALACGLPCIATRSGINAELLGDGTGVLVTPHRPDELAAAIGALVADTGRRRQLALAARERAVGEFDNHRLAERKAQFFQEVAT